MSFVKETVAGDVGIWEDNRQLRRALRDLLELVEVSSLENRDLPNHEYEALANEALSQARRVLRDHGP